MRGLTNEIELGAALRTRRGRTGLTQARVAELAGVSRAFVIDLERGRRPRAELHRVLSVIRALDAAVVLVDHRETPPEELLATLLGER
jgi:HTH-type transcriptional regulator / antitoxin HipB